MRSTRTFYLVGLLYLLSGVAEAESIVCDGVLGNSGERGPWLVRGDASNNGRIGIGVVYDRHGTLWHRCSSHGLSRFSPDGRLLGHFRLPNGHEGTSGVLTHAGNEIVALLNGVGMFAVSTDAAPGSDVRPLKYDGIKAISYGSRDGKLAAVDKNEQLLLLKISDASAERLVAVPGGYAVEMTPDGAIYVFRFDGRQHGNVHRYVNSVEDADSWPRRYN